MLLKSGIIQDIKEPEVSRRRIEEQQQQVQLVSDVRPRSELRAMLASTVLA
jgi:hypothetical protein